MATPRTQDIVGHLKGFDKASHATSLARVLRRRCSAEDIQKKISDANELVSELRKGGLTSFYSAEYAKVFQSSEKAFSWRGQAAAHFEEEHGLSTRQANKMADCILFSAAKKQSESRLDRLTKIASEALSAGVEFNIVADTVYYTSADADGSEFARRMIMTSARKSKPVDISQPALAKRLEAALS